MFKLGQILDEITEECANWCNENDYSVDILENGKYQIAPSKTVITILEDETNQMNFLQTAPERVDDIETNQEDIILLLADMIGVDEE